MRDLESKSIPIQPGLSSQDSYARRLHEAMQDYDDSRYLSAEAVIGTKPHDIGYYLSLLAPGFIARTVRYPDKYSEVTVKEGKAVVKEAPNALTDIALIIIPEGHDVYSILAVREARNYALSDHPYKEVLNTQFHVTPATTTRDIANPEEGILFSGVLSYDDRNTMVFNYEPRLVPASITDKKSYIKRQQELADIYMSGNPSHIQTLLMEAARR